MRISDWSSDVCSSDLQGKSIREYTQQYEDAFLQDSAALRLERPERIVRATEHIDDMVKAVEQLAANGHTYQSDGSTYFRIATFRSEERRVGKECVSTCRSRWSPCN